jgi:DNA-binding Lrp family transcriptional regulator
MIRSVTRIAALLALMAVAALPGPSESSRDLQTFFRKNIGLSKDQIAAIRNGQPVAKALPPRTPAEVLLFGAVYIHASAETYFQFARNFDRLRQVPGYLALGVFTDPPQLSDLRGFALDSDDVQALKSCEPGDCRIQMPATTIEELHQSINWSAPDVDERVNQLLQKTVFERLLAYQREGNKALGVYNDKRDPTAVPEQFAYLLSYHNALPEHAPDFYHYLLSYPHGKPAKFEETFFWTKVKFGLKPTLRIEHMVTMRGRPADPVACAIAKKQLYSSHYFETAVDLSICVRDADDPKQPGFYLLKALGSEQAGLTGAKGSIVRKAAVGRAVSNLQKGLAALRDTMQGNQ